MFVFFVLFLIGCGSKDPGSKNQAPKVDEKPAVLNVFIWSDYLAPELVKEFEAKYNCKVQLSFFESNEQMITKVKGGGSAYDVLYPSSYAVTMLVRDEFLLPLDHSKIPNLKNIDSNYKNLIAEPEMEHSVPYMVSTTGIGFLSELGDLEPTWAVLGRPELKGRITLLDDMREVIGAALKFNGFSLNSTNEDELAKARDTVIEWKRNAAKFESTQYHYGLASGEFKMVHGYGGDILQAQSENPDIRFMLPKEGFAFTCDQMVVPKNAPNPDLAHAWINFLHEPDVAARNTTEIMYLCPNSGSYEKLDKALLDNPAVFPPAEVLARAEYISDLGEDLAKYVKVWDEIKAAE